MPYTQKNSLHPQTRLSDVELKSKNTFVCLLFTGQQLKWDDTLNEKLAHGPDGGGGGSGGGGGAGGRGGGESGQGEKKNPNSSRRV